MNTTQLHSLCFFCPSVFFVSTRLSSNAAITTPWSRLASLGVQIEKWIGVFISNNFDRVPHYVDSNSQTEHLWVSSAQRGSTNVVFSASSGSNSVNLTAGFSTFCFICLAVVLHTAQPMLCLCNTVLGEIYAVIGVHLDEIIYQATIKGWSPVSAFHPQTSVYLHYISTILYCSVDTFGYTSARTREATPVTRVYHTPLIVRPRL